MVPDMTHAFLVIGPWDVQPGLWLSHHITRSFMYPNTDFASISGVLHLVWPLAQSLFSMAVPTRSQNFSWNSLWDLRGTQAPQLRQSNNTLGVGGGGYQWKHRYLTYTQTSMEKLKYFLTWYQSAIISVKATWPKRWYSTENTLYNAQL